MQRKVTNARVDTIQKAKMLRFVRPKHRWNQRVVYMNCVAQYS